MNGKSINLSPPSSAGQRTKHLIAQFANYTVLHRQK